MFQTVSRQEPQLERGTGKVPTGGTINGNQNRYHRRTTQEISAG